MGRDMINFSQTLGALGMPDFNEVLMREIERLSVSELPLQRGLTTGSHALDDDIQAMILNVWESDDFIHVKAGLFYRSIIAGCSCADDPTPVDEVNEHCVVQIDINKKTAEATITLLKE